MSTYNRATLYQQFRKDIAKEYNTEVRAAKAYANSIKERAMEAARAKADELYEAAFEEKIAPARDKYNKAISEFNIVHPKTTTQKPMDPLVYARVYSEYRDRIAAKSHPKNINPDTVTWNMDQMYGKKSLPRWDENDFKRAFDWLATIPAQDEYTKIEQPLYALE